MKIMLNVCVLGAALAIALPAAADRGSDDGFYDERGPYIGLAGMGNFVVNQANAPVQGFIDQGGGFSVFVGVPLGRIVGLEIAYVLNVHNPVEDPSGAVFDALLLHAGQLDLKITIPTPSNWRPYFQAGLGIYELARYANSSEYRNGIGFQLGGGLDIWLNRGVSVGARALYHGISFTQSIAGFKPFLSTVSVEGNVQFHI